MQAQYRDWYSICQCRRVHRDGARCTEHHCRLALVPKPRPHRRLFQNHYTAARPLRRRSGRFWRALLGNMTLVRKIVARQAYNTGEDFLSTSARRTELASRIISGVVGVIASVIFGLWPPDNGTRCSAPKTSSHSVSRTPYLRGTSRSSSLHSRCLSSFKAGSSVRLLSCCLWRSLHTVSVLCWPYMISPEDDEGERREIPRNIIAGAPIRIHLSALGFLVMF